jgi:hypothetical protein
MNVPPFLKSKKTWLIAGGVGVVALLLYARAGGGRQQTDDGGDAIDYQLGYYLPGGGGLPVGAGSASNDNAMTDKLFGIASEAQKLQASQVYSGIFAEMTGQLTDDLVKAKKPGAEGKFNFGGQLFDFDFTFKAPAPAVKPPTRKPTVHTTTKVFGANQGNGIDARNDRNSSSGRN